MSRHTSPVRKRSTEVTIMEKPEDVAAMQRLHAAGWGLKRIASELGCSRNTVRRYLRAGGWVGYGCGDGRRKTLDGLEEWLEAALRQHRGNAEVVRQELVRVHGIEVSLRTVERAVQGYRDRIRAAALATVRFETPPGRQLQADFGEIRVRIGGEVVRVHLCVLTLGYSRRLFVRAYRHERQHSWLATMEESFRHFGGVPDEVLVDNARALVAHHDVEKGEVVFNDRFAQFAAWWGFKPRACAPYRARTKGKDERGVGYVKRNAVAGREFESWESFEAWLAQWSRDIADQRVHGTTGERPIARFERDEVKALRPLPNKGSFLAERELVRTVHNDACIEVDSNWYSVPWTLLKATVTVQVRDQQVRVLHAGRVVATHARAEGRRKRVVDDAHWDGLIRRPAIEVDQAPDRPTGAELGRSLEEYQRLVEELSS